MLLIVLADVEVHVLILRRLEQPGWDGKLACGKRIADGTARAPTHAVS